jgi:broad specificity phosphatase PhoE
MQKTTIYITRHGQTQWNLEGRMQGHQDSPLTELGIRQATWLRDALHAIEFDGIYASSSPRAKKTAEIIRDQRSCEVIGCDDLREIAMGKWEGMIGKEIQQSHPLAYDAFWQTPHLYTPENGGESFYDLQKRVIPFIDALISENEGKTILIAAHAGTVKTIMGYFEDRPLADFWNPPMIHPTALSKVIVDNQHAHIALYADTSHHQE